MLTYICSPSHVDIHMFTITGFASILRVFYSFLGDACIRTHSYSHDTVSIQYLQYHITMYMRTSLVCTCNINPIKIMNDIYQFNPNTASAFFSNKFLQTFDIDKHTLTSELKKYIVDTNFPEIMYGFMHALYFNEFNETSPTVDLINKHANAYAVYEHGSNDVTYFHNQLTTSFEYIYVATLYLAQRLNQYPTLMQCFNLTNVPNISLDPNNEPPLSSTLVVAYTLFIILFVSGVDKNKFTVIMRKFVDTSYHVFFSNDQNVHNRADELSKNIDVTNIHAIHVVFENYLRILPKAEDKIRHIITASYYILRSLHITYFSDNLSKSNHINITEITRDLLDINREDGKYKALDAAIHARMWTQIMFMHELDYRHDRNLTDNVVYSQQCSQRMWIDNVSRMYYEMKDGNRLQGGLSTHVVNTINDTPESLGNAVQPKYTFDVTDSVGNRTYDSNVTVWDNSGVSNNGHINSVISDVKEVDDNVLTLHEQQPQPEHITVNTEDVRMNVDVYADTTDTNLCIPYGLAFVYALLFTISPNKTQVLQPQAEVTYVQSIDYGKTVYDTFRNDDNPLYDIDSVGNTSSLNDSLFESNNNVVIIGDSKTDKQIVVTRFRKQYSVFCVDSDKENNFVLHTNSIADLKVKILEFYNITSKKMTVVETRTKDLTEQINMLHKKWWIFCACMVVIMALIVSVIVVLYHKKSCCNFDKNMKIIQGLYA